MIRHASSTLFSVLAACLLISLTACGGGGGGSTPPPPPQPPTDRTPPDTTLAGSPPALTNATTASFTFTATEAGSTFESRLDGAAFAAATSPVNLNGVGEGSHTFEVRARDASGNMDSSPAFATWVVDTTAPETTVDTSPSAATPIALAAFTFSSADSSAGFEVSLDDAPFVAATSPYSVNVTEGPHNLRVRARDLAGNIDATPVSVTWIFDPIAPDTEITSAPPTTTPVSSASFSFSSSDITATFEVSLDGGAFVAATSPYQAGVVTNGPHIFRVRARDAAGNVDPSPASAAYIADTVGPTGRIVFPPPVSYTEATTLTVRGAASDANGVSSVRVNGVAATSTDGFATWSVQIPITVTGANPIVLAVTDTAGIETSSADTATVHNRGPTIQLVQGLAFDPTGDRLLIVDQRTSNLYAYNAGDRLGRTIADLGSLSTLPDASFGGSIAVDAANNRAILAHGPSDRIAAVNLATGAVNVISPSPGAGLPTSIGLSSQIALDPANDRAFATLDSEAVVSIDLSTGARAVVTSSSVGTGVAINLPFGIAYDAQSVPGSPRLLVADLNYSSPVIISVDVATGNRTTFSALGVRGTGPAFSSPSSIQLDAANNRLLVMDLGAHRLVAVSLANGNRSYLTGSGVGSGVSMLAQTGVALSPSGRIYTGQQGGEVLEVNPTTLARSLFVGGPLGAGLRIANGRALILESAESLLYLDRGRESVMRVDLLTGNRSVVSSVLASVGSGPDLRYAADMVLDRRAPSPGSRVFVTVGTPTDTLYSVDLATGDRGAVASLNLANPYFDEAGSMALDVSGNRMLFVDSVGMMANANSLFAVDLATGLRTTISENSTVGTGPGIGRPIDLVLEPAGNPTRAIVSNLESGANGPNYLSVDLATGNRTIFAPASGPSVGLPANVPTWMHLDAANNRLLAINSDPESLFFMPLVTPLRTLVSGVDERNGNVRGTGMKPFGTAIEYDAANGIAYTFGLEGSLVAIDVASGDRVQVSH
ncbi:MAG TPA: hypothetical protein VFS58_07140 [Steroidobacteraceae bacterium]|nr:hypothetical protein [Steroidobacteraceae bacterium]